jgi:hypothetical protein
MPKKIQIDIKAEELKKKLNIQNGKDGKNGKDGAKGEKGDKGDTPDVTEVALEASKLAQIELESKIPTITQITDQIPVLGEKVRDSLELLNGDERLDKDAIRGLDDYEEISKLARQPKQVIKKYTSSGGVQDHNTLSNLQGGMLGEYYHLKSAEHSRINTKTLTLSGNLRSSYLNSPYVFLLDMENSTLYPSGVTINSIYVKSNSASPTTELTGKIVYCDGQGTGAFPGASPTDIATITTTTGNYSQTGMTTSVATGKIIYLEMTADPTDYLSFWTITINFTIN